MTLGILKFLKTLDFCKNRLYNIYVIKIQATKGILKMCNHECKTKWVKGKGSFAGWRLKLCAEHQIIHKMIKIS